MAEMRGAIARGAAWMVLFRLLDRSIGIVSTAVLARLLLPEDFGLVAMAMSVIAVIELASSFSFEIALIQKSDPTREHFDTAWTLNILVGAAGALATALLAWPAATFYGDERVVPVMLAIGGAWLLAGFENTGTANFRRAMNFSAEFRLMATKRMVSFAVTMVAALLLQSYWALIIGTATNRAMGVVLSYTMQPFRPRLSLSRSRELFSFSGWLIANNLAGVVLGKVPHFAVGKLFGAQALGAYTIGAEIAHLAYTELVAPINRATFAGYARMKDDRPAFRSTCLDATAAILLIVLPVSSGVALLAAPVVRILLGAQWGAAVPIIQVLAFAGVVSAITSNNVAAYLALGRPHLATSILVSRLIMLLCAMLALAGVHGMLGVALAELIAAAGSLLVSLPILLRTLELPTRDYLRALWRPLTATAVMAATLAFIMQLLPAPDDVPRALLMLAVTVPAGALVYPLAVALAWWASGRPESVERLIWARFISWASARFATRRAAR
ncbi:MAG: lipopolysaccharide biosynthesis protein [Piscinibacter sp.]|uniref:lipopolysaccharide biosynthesis protein n=1 Tax=Piscinibacter sp. TaxID=1903157 RepID=UPI003D13627C